MKKKIYPEIEKALKFKEIREETTRILKLTYLNIF
jgi:hypothetical protein